MIPARALRPAGVRLVNAGNQDLAGLRLHELVHPVGAEPMGDHHEQRPAVLAPEHARVARTIDLDAVDDLAPFAHAEDAAPSVVADGTAPHSTFAVEADAVARDIRPEAPVREAADRGRCRRP